MNKEDKELLLQDICTRFPYYFVVEYEGGIYSIENINYYGGVQLINCNHSVPFYEVKPYLRPLSSMTEKDNLSLAKYVGCRVRAQDGEIYFPNIDDNILPNWEKAFTWFRLNRFDYNDLCKKGLAIAITEDNNPYKTID